MSIGGQGREEEKEGGKTQAKASIVTEEDRKRSVTVNKPKLWWLNPEGSPVLKAKRVATNLKRGPPSRVLNPQLQAFSPVIRPYDPPKTSKLD